jgi:hypothetical protein
MSVFMARKDTDFRAAVRDPHRLMLFALALLIHAGLFQLLLLSRRRVRAHGRSADRGRLEGRVTTG